MFGSHGDVNDVLSSTSFDIFNVGCSQIACEECSFTCNLTTPTCQYLLQSAHLAFKSLLIFQFLLLLLFLSAQLNNWGRYHGFDDKTMKIVRYLFATVQFGQTNLYHTFPIHIFVVKMSKSHIPLAIIALFSWQSPSFRNF